MSDTVPPTGPAPGEFHPIFSIGHSTRTLEEFISLLRENGVTMLADVRTVPRSRHNPQFNRDTFPAALASAGIGYRHLASLGGLRHTTASSVNTGWRNTSFRGYADYMQTDGFVAGLNDLLDLMRKDTVAMMCAEAVPWRCHRSLIGDALLVRGIPVEDIMGPEHLQLHHLTPFAHVDGLRITYPPEQTTTAPSGNRPPENKS